MKKIALSFLFFFAIIAAHAQFKQTNYSETFASNGFHLQGIYTDSELTVWTVFTEKEKNFNRVQLVKSEMNSGKTTSSTITLKSELTEISGGYPTNAGFSFIGVQKIAMESRSTSTIILYETDGSKIIAEKRIASFETKNKNGLGKVKFAQSPDAKKKLFFIEHAANPSPSEKETIQLLIVDEKGNETTNKVVDLDIESKINVHNYPQIANDGTVYFLKKDREKNAHRYFIYSYIPSSGNLNHKQINLPNAHISEIKGCVTFEGDFLVGGFTSSEPVHNYEGYYLFKFDNGCTQKFKTQGQFDEPTFLKVLTKKEYSKNPVINDFFMDNIIQLPSGKIFFTAENYTEEQPKDGDVIGTYGKVLLLCFDEAGKYKTSYIQTKKQTAEGPETDWTSYKCILNTDTLTMFHNNLVKTEGLGHVEPVLQTTNFHERTGAKITAKYEIRNDGEAPFFLPGQTLSIGKNKSILVFSDFKRTKFQLVMTEE